MKQKVGTLIEENLMRSAKRRAMEERCSLSNLIQNALEVYLAGKGPAPKEREAAYRFFCETPMRLRSHQWKAVLQDDPWDR